MKKPKARRPHLNELSAPEWIKFTKSWFVLDPVVNKAQIAAHPAAFPIELPTEFIRFFTRSEQIVLDPFGGTGTTLLAARQLNREAHGIELEPEFADFSEKHYGITMQIGDATSMLTNQENYPDEFYDYVITSPPYINALHKSRGGNKDTRHKKRKNGGYAIDYGDNPQNIGNISDVKQYIQRLIETFTSVHRVLKPKAYCTVIIQNLNFDGSLKPIAWQFALAMTETNLWDMKGEKVWCQSKKKLGIYGYPYAYATNNFHHYCLTFRKQ